MVSTSLREGAEFVRRGIIPTATATGLVLIEAIAVLVMAIYMAVRPALYQEGLLALVPPRHRAFARAIVLDLAQTLRAWVAAQLFAMVVLAILTGIGLWLLAVPYWLAFALFAGVVVLIPFFGTLFSTLLPALLVLPGRGAPGGARRGVRGRRRPPGRGEPRRPARDAAQGRAPAGADDPERADRGRVSRACSGCWSPSPRSPPSSSWCATS